MTDKLVLKSSHEVIYTVDVADVESIFYCKPTDPDILTVLMKDGKRLYCDEVCPIDSLQENPVCAFSTNRYTDEDRKVLCDGCEEECEYAKKEHDLCDFCEEKNEPVSEELERAAIEICSKVLKGETIIIDGYEYVVLSDAEECFIAGAEWQKEYMIKEIKIRLVDAATNQDKSTDVVEQTYYNGMVDALGRLRDKFMED